MKKLIAAALIGATLAASALPSFAGEGEGVVAQVDMDTRTVILEDGSSWTAADDVDISELAVGDAIKVMYQDGTTVLTSVEKM